VPCKGIGRGRSGVVGASPRQSPLLLKLAGDDISAALGLVRRVRSRNEHLGKKMDLEEQFSVTLSAMVL
jgi:hypothetical protein